MTHNNNSESSHLDAVRLLLERLGVTPEDLRQAMPRRSALSSCGCISKRPADAVEPSRSSDVH